MSSSIDLNTCSLEELEKYYRGVKWGTLCRNDKLECVRAFARLHQCAEDIHDIMMDGPNIETVYQLAQRNFAFASLRKRRLTNGGRATLPKASEEPSKGTGPPTSYAPKSRRASVRSFSIATISTPPCLLPHRSQRHGPIADSEDFKQCYEGTHWPSLTQPERWSCAAIAAALGLTATDVEHILSGADWISVLRVARRNKIAMLSGAEPAKDPPRSPVVVSHPHEVESDVQKFFAWRLTQG